MSVKLIGMKATVMASGRNQGKTGYTYYFQKDFSDYDRENSTCQGVCVSQEFSYTDFGVAIGDEVTLVYDKGFQDRAVLTNLIPFKSDSGKAPAGGK